MNPADLSWQLASRLSADCLLMMAPLIVDSAATKRTLIENCGLQPLFDQAGQLDLAVVSCGDVSDGGTSLSRNFLSPDDFRTLMASDAVCDVMCQFLNESGATVPHPIHDRVMSVDLDSIAAARHVVIASGGALRAIAIRASARRLRCNTLITDEAAARVLPALTEPAWRSACDAIERRQEQPVDAACGLCVWQMPGIRDQVQCIGRDTGPGDAERIDPVIRPPRSA